jgi:C4-dicarboxylate-specific signal transduction histidine kinase
MARQAIASRRIGDTVTRGAWQRFSIVVGLLLLLTYFLIQSRGPDLTLRARMEEAFQSFALHDAELTRDVLLVRAGLLPNYDSLTAISREWSQDLETLRREAASGSRAAASALREPIEALDLAVQRKRALIEHFKSDNALLRNSLIFFDRAGRASSSQSGRETAFVSETGALSRAMLRFTVAPDSSSSMEVQTVLNRISKLPLSQDFHDLVAHGQLVSQVLPGVDTQLDEIIAASTAAHVHAMQDAVLRYSKQVESRAQVFRFLLYCAALILLGYLVHQFVRLRLNAVALLRANEELKDRIAERNRLEEANRQQEMQLIQANKMTALGILVSGLAHEINNPNQLVLTNSRVLTKVWQDAVRILDGFQRANDEFTLARLPYAEIRETVAALIRDVNAGALRIGRIVDDLKNFARPRARAVTDVFQLNDAVQRAMRLLAHLIKQRTVKLHVSLAPKLPAMRGNAQQVEQIVINLLVNALEALPDRDRAIAVSTFFAASSGAVVLEVRDEGIGIAPEHLERVCDPFFTTKQETGGTGLGLAICLSLARAHNGCLEFASEPGKGTRVLVKFGCIDDPRTLCVASDCLPAYRTNQL